MTGRRAWRILAGIVSRFLLFYFLYNYFARIYGLPELSFVQTIGLLATIKLALPEAFYIRSIYEYGEPLKI